MQDTYGRKITYLRLSVTDLCNLRCRYCMPEEGVPKRRHEEMLSQEELIQAVDVAAELGVHKVRITGGEPLVKRNIVSICKQVRAVPGIREVCLTTNGTRLPELALPLREAGVSRVNISLDTLDPEKYRWVTRVGNVEQALEGIRAALEAGFEKVKINAVLVGGWNEDEIRNLAALSLRDPIDVRFIELMPMVREFESSAFIPGARVLEEMPELEAAGDDGVARMYRLPGARGRIGLISPVSAHFCGDCSRLRLTADGKLKPCLHSPLEFDIRGLDRDGVRQQMLRACGAKPEKHEALAWDQMSKAGRTMNRIGG